MGDMPDTCGFGVDEDTARAAIDAIFDGQSNLLDTSRNYGFGRSEERIGAAIRARGGLPKGFVLSTKLDRDMETGCFVGDRAVEAVCARHAVALGAAALQFSRRDPRIACTIVGVSKAVRVRRTLDWATSPVPVAARRDLDSLAFSTVDTEVERVYLLG